MNRIEHKTNELLMFDSGFHDNQVPIGTWYDADAYCRNEPTYQIQTEYDLRQRSY